MWVLSVEREQSQLTLPALLVSVPCWLLFALDDDEAASYSEEGSKSCLKFYSAS